LLEQKYKVQSDLIRFIRAEDGQSAGAAASAPWQEPSMSLPPSLRLRLPGGAAAIGRRP